MRKTAAMMLCILTIAIGSIAMAEAYALGDDTAIAELTDKQWEFHPLLKTTVTKVAQITGEDSENQTLSRFGVWGVDLGSMAVVGDTTYMFGGDTFGDENSGSWRSNVLFLIQDDNPYDGLTIVDVITDEQGMAKELLSSEKVDYSEITVIPTNIFAVDDTLYCIYMSVSHWGEAGSWDCGYSGLAKSENLGEDWVKLTDVRWCGDSNFVQTANYQVGDTMYFWGIPSGRSGGVSLMKVNIEDIENYDCYEYYIGEDDEGVPVWLAGEDGLEQATIVINSKVGEISVVYNPYLGNFLMTYLSGRNNAIVMREGITPWGPWSKEYILASSSAYPSLYGAYMHTEYLEDGGQTFFFAMSQFFPIYNIMWMQAILP